MTTTMARMAGACFIVVVGAAAGTSSTAEVLSVTAGGFEVQSSAHIGVSPDKVYAALLVPARWWSSDHTFSGSAANLVLDARAGGCWCETLPGGGSVEHLHVLYVVPGKTLRMRGALGPFQGLTVDGVMTWSVKPAAGGSDLSFTYAVFGASKDGFADLSAGADRVLGEQISQLKKVVEADAMPHNP
jgi:uncharacterized protein YndB with AHSA1/START domain